MYYTLSTPSTTHTHPQMYVFLPHDSACQHASAVLLSYPKVITLSGMSKCFGMPGIRIGWLISQDTAFMNSIATQKDYTTICNAGPSEFLALVVLQHAGKVVGDIRQVVTRNARALEVFVSR